MALDNQGRVRGAHLDIQLFPGEANLNAFWQPWGFPATDQVFPHRAFRVKDAAKLDELMARLEGARVPTVLATRKEVTEGEPVPGRPSESRSKVPTIGICSYRRSASAGIRPTYPPTRGCEWTVA